MAQYTADFAGDTPGSPPSGFTARWNTTGSPVWSVVTDTDASADRITTLTGASTAKRLLSFDAVDSDGDRDDVEVLIRVQASNLTSDDRPLVIVRGSGASGLENGYAVALSNSGINFFKYTNGSGVRFYQSPALFALPNATWLYVRFRINGTTLQARAWTDRQPEPGWWSAQTVDSAVTGTGWVGLHAFSNITSYSWDYLIVATNGDTADFDDLPISDDVRATKTNYAAVVNIPSEGIKANQAFYTVVCEKAETLQANKAAYAVVCLGKIELPYILAWTFTLDGHDYYVLQLQEDTLVYDFHAEQWYVWGTGTSSLWKGQIGINWNADISAVIESLVVSDPELVTNIIVGDYENGALYFLDPDRAVDDTNDGGSYTRFTRIVYGQIVHRGRDWIPCAAVEVEGSIGNNIVHPTVNLSYSDDRGNTFTSAGDITIAGGSFDTRLDWRSLGSIKTPGRLFKLTDQGALVRIDGMDLHIDGT